MPLKTPLFAFDLDECVVDFLAALVPIIKERHGIEVSGEYVSTSGIERHYNISQVNLDECINLAISNIDLIKPAQGAIDFLLAYHYESGRPLLFITSRWNRESTVGWLSSQFFPIPWEVHFVKGHLKGGVAKKRGVRIFVEDHEEGILDLAKNKIRVLLMDKPWNKGISNSKYIKRVSSWYDILDIYRRLRTREAYRSVFGCDSTSKKYSCSMEEGLNAP